MYCMGKVPGCFFRHEMSDLFNVHSAIFIMANKLMTWPEYTRAVDMSLTGVCIEVCSCYA